ncbi:MAG: hypothetical protein AAB624_02230 [Patescibacteria group bacterium]
MSESLKFKETLREKQAVPIGVDIGYCDYEEALRAFQEFMQLPETIVEASRFKLREQDKSLFGAFERRVGSASPEARGLAQDNKDIFHFGSLTRQVMEYRLGKNLPAEAKWFLSTAEDIYWAGLRSTKEAFELLDTEKMGLVGIHFDERANLNHHLRFIAYYPREGDILATPHYDRSVGTVAMAESKPGLWIEVDEKKQYVENRKPDEGLFFLGAGWDKLPDRYRHGNYDLRPTMHGVDQIDSESDQGGVMRWAIILFSNPIELDTVPLPEETRPHRAFGQEVFAAM